MGAAQLGDDLGVGEPLGDLAAVGQPVAQLGAGDARRLGAFWYLVDGHVVIFGRHVHHELEGHQRHAELLLVLDDELLGVVRPVERVAVGVGTGAGMVAADDEVGARRGSCG